MRKTLLEAAVQAWKSDLDERKLKWECAQTWASLFQVVAWYGDSDYEPDVVPVFISMLADKITRFSEGILAFDVDNIRFLATQGEPVGSLLTWDYWVCLEDNYRNRVRVTDLVQLGAVLKDADKREPGTDVTRTD